MINSSVISSIAKYHNMIFIVEYTEDSIENNAIVDNTNKWFSFVIPYSDHDCDLYLNAVVV